MIFESCNQAGGHVAAGADFHGICRSRNNAITLASRMAVRPWPIRSAPSNSTASRMLSGRKLPPHGPRRGAPGRAPHEKYQGKVLPDRPPRRRRCQKPTTPCERVASRPVQHLAYMVHAELPGGVKYPFHPHSRAPFGFVRSCGHRLKDRVHRLLLPQHHARGEDDFRIPNVLTCQPLHQSRGYQA